MISEGVILGQSLDQRMKQNSNDFDHKPGPMVKVRGGWHSKKMSQKNVNKIQKACPNEPGPKAQGRLRRSKVLLQLPSTSCRSIILIMITMNMIIMIIMIITIIIMMIIIMMVVMTCPQAPSLDNEYGEQTNWDTETLLIFFEKCTH